MTVLGALAASRQDDAEMLRVVQSVAYMANRWFMPASLLTLAFGVATAIVGGLFAQFWVILGLVGAAAAFATGALVLGPTAEKIHQFEAAGRPTDAYPLGRRLLEAAKFDYVVMFVVTADMVIKPTLADVATLAVLAAVVVAGALLFLLGAFRQAPARV